MARRTNDSRSAVFLIPALLAGWALVASACLSLGEESDSKSSFEDIFKEQFGANPENRRSAMIDNSWLETDSTISIPESFSVAAWVKPTTAPGGHANRVILDGDVASNFMIAVDMFGTGYQFAVNCPTYEFGNSYGGSVQLDTWAFVVGTYDGAIGRLYVDGELVASETFASPGPMTTKVAVGAIIGGGSNWKGLIDEVAIWGKALGPEEIISLYAGGKPQLLALDHGNYSSKDSLLTWWTMGDGLADSELQIIDLMGAANLAGYGLTAGDEVVLVGDVP